ncbi:MAG: hypothetical protein EVG15_04460 [Candidatus Acididesulfobacter diazotrophicus]|jgi:hypothetical protein|uniref:DUF4214 domain-containing protein n=1 Tax=Candidatus Acididesulfobacter diazotrophicus TaxID=2597226 RepID=A0A519BN46_9DELT|nr:MAG: hypothetical protein EVG15_04460 [Candidatus Acididesulfobacter diazotrophicus]
MATSPVDSEVNALFLGLFDRPAAPNGQAYWADQFSANPNAALNSISTFVNGGAAFTNATIGAEITNIFENLLGRAPLPGGLDYWSSQYIGTGGTQTIGQITADIYNITTAKPITSPYPFDTLTMNDKLSAMQTFTTNYAVYNQLNGPASYASATSYLNNAISQANVQNSTVPTSINGAQTAYVPVSPTSANNTYQAASGNYSFVGGTVGANTINLGGSPSSVYTYSITGGTGANTVDVNYAGVTAADLTTYLGSASGFETLDFTVVPSAPLILNLSAVDGNGFNTIQNASGNEIFNVNTNTTSLTISDATGQTVANVHLGGGVTLGTLDTYLASPTTLNPTTVDIVSNGTTPNAITNLDVASGSTVNIAGPDNLTLTTAATGLTYDYSTFLGTSLTINGTQEIISPTGPTAAPSAPTAPTYSPPSATTSQTSYTLTSATYNTTNSPFTGGFDGNYYFNIPDQSGYVTLTAGNGNDTVNIASGNSGANTITIGNTTAGAGNDAIYSAGTGAITATLGISGATGNDTISMSGANTAADTFTINSNGTDAVYMTGLSTAGNTVTINGGSGIDTVMMTGGSTAGNTVTINGGSGDVNVTMTGGNTGTNTISINGSGTDTVWVGQGDHTINLGAGSGNGIGTTGPVAISIGQGANSITLGTGIDSINMTTAYTGTAGANTLSGVIAGDTLVFNQSASTAAATLVTTTTGTTQTALDTAGSQTTIAGEITYLQGIDTTAGYTTVGLITDATGAAVVMNHALTTTTATTPGTYVDQVIQIVGTASYLTGSTIVSVNAAHFVSVAL